jgi:hypothetical protein
LPLRPRHIPHRRPEVTWLSRRAGRGRADVEKGCWQGAKKSKESKKSKKMGMGITGPGGWRGARQGKVAKIAKIAEATRRRNRGNLTVSVGRPHSFEIGVSELELF